MFTGRLNMRRGHIKHDRCRGERDGEIERERERQRGRKRGRKRNRKSQRNRATETEIKRKRK